MPRPTALVAALLPIAATLGGCAKQQPAEYGTTRISSATPSGPMVTNVRAEDADSADQLAAAICRHESRCIHRGTRSAAETPARGGAACVAEVRPSAVLNLDALDCSPAEARAGLKECLAALASDDCSSTLSSDPVLVPACRPTMICASGAPVVR
jgi:hypothetical protein